MAASFDAAGGMDNLGMDLAMLSDVLLRPPEAFRTSLVEELQHTLYGLPIGFRQRWFAATAPRVWC